MRSFQQKMDHTCGACCVMDVCDHFGLPVLSERTLAKKLHAKFATGIEPWRIEAYLRSVGLSAEYKEEKNLPTLVRRLNAGWIPIVCWSDWGGHYCIVARYMPSIGWSGGQLDLIDPAAQYEGNLNRITPEAPYEPWVKMTTVSLDRFKSMWFTPRTRKQREVIYVKDERVPQSDI